MAPNRNFAICHLSFGGTGPFSLDQSLLSKESTHHSENEVSESLAAGTLDSHRFALILDSKTGADLGQIQDLIRPAGALLVGAYRPSDLGP
jgi:hypothetical protein